MIKYRLIGIFLLSFVLLCSSCGITDQTRGMKNFAKCSFRIRDVQDMALAGVNVQDVQSFSDFDFVETGRITTALLSGDLPLTFTLNIEIQNPNQEQALMNELEWILFIDDAEITKGTINKKIEIIPGGINVLPVGLNLDLLELLSGESSSSIMNFGLNLSGNGGTPSRMKLKIKPSIYVSGKRISYPGYISIEDEFVFE
jgi:hypothetical protein